MIAKRLVTDWVVQTLETASGMEVGRGRVPATNTVPPFYLLYSVDTYLAGAPLADMSEQAALVYQFTSVSGPDPAVPEATADLSQLEWMADTVRSTFLARDPATGLWLRPFTVPGMSCMARRLEVEWGGQPGGTSEQEAGMMTYVQRIRFDLTTV